MQLPPLPVEVFKACIVRAVRSSEALILRLVHRTEVSLQLALSQSDDAKEMLYFRVWQAWAGQRTALLSGYPKALMTALGRAESSQLSVAAQIGLTDPQTSAFIDQFSQQISTQITVEKTQANLGAMFAQLLGIEAGEVAPNPLHSSRYVEALCLLLSEARLEFEVLEGLLNTMQPHLCALLIVEYGHLVQQAQEHGFLLPMDDVTALSDDELLGATDAERLSPRAQVRQGSWRAPHRYGDAMTQSRAYSRQINRHDEMVRRLIQTLSNDGSWMDKVTEAPLLPEDLVATFAAEDFHDTAPQSWDILVDELPASMGGDISNEEKTQDLLLNTDTQAAPEAILDAGQAAVLSGEQSEESSQEMVVAVVKAELEIQPEPELVSEPEVKPEPQSVPVPPEEVLQQVLAEITDAMELMPEVQRVVQDLEPVLLELARIDKNFAINPDHPARHLLEELVARSQRFANEQSSGYAQFIQVAHVAVTQLQMASEPDADTFAIVLETISREWSRIEVRPRNEPRSAVGAVKAAAVEPAAKALQPELAPAKADAAARMTPDAASLAKAIHQLPGADQVPADILEFLTETWAQVIAKAYRVVAEQKQDEYSEYRADAAASYLALVPSLLWSASGAAVHDTHRLSLLVPRLQERLSYGLQSIGKPTEEIQKISARLAGLYQDTLDAGEALAMQPPIALDGAGQVLVVDIPLSFDEDFAPEPEAVASQASAVSGAELTPDAAEADSEVLIVSAVAAEVHIEAVAETDVQVTLQAQQLRAAHDDLNVAMASASSSASVAEDAQGEQDDQAAETATVLAVEWPVGSWVQLQNAEQKILTQLTWMNPEQKLFMFTAPDGRTQSMTRRTRDKLVGQGRLRRVIFSNTVPEIV